MAKNTKDTEPKAPTKVVVKFTKKQFVASQRFAKQRDLVNALLKDDETYSIAEVEDTIKKFLSGK